MDLNHLTTLMDEVRTSGFSEGRLCEAGIALELKRTVPESVMPSVSAAGVNETARQMSGGMNTDAGNAGEKPGVVPENIQGSAEKSEDAAVVKAQMAGTFYTSAKPGEDPYVKEGSRVSKGDTLGLLEAMKVISEITAPVSGTVERVMLEDAAFAEFDAPLFRIRTV